MRDTLYRVRRRKARIHREIEQLGHGHNQRGRGDTQRKVRPRAPWHVEGWRRVLARVPRVVLAPSPPLVCALLLALRVSPLTAYGPPLLCGRVVQVGLRNDVQSTNAEGPVHYAGRRYVPLPPREGPPDHQTCRHATSPCWEVICIASAEPYRPKLGGHMA